MRIVSFRPTTLRSQERSPARRNVSLSLSRSLPAQKQNHHKTTLELADLTYLCVAGILSAILAVSCVVLSTIWASSTTTLHHCRAGRGDGITRYLLRNSVFGIGAWAKENKGTGLGDRCNPRTKTGGTNVPIGTTVGSSVHKRSPPARRERNAMFRALFAAKLLPGSTSSPTGLVKVYGTSKYLPFFSAKTRTTRRGCAGPALPGDMDIRELALGVVHLGSKNLKRRQDYVESRQPIRRKKRERVAAVAADTAAAIRNGRRHRCRCRCCFPSRRGVIVRPTTSNFFGGCCRVKRAA